MSEEEVAQLSSAVENWEVARPGKGKVATGAGKGKAGRRAGHCGYHSQKNTMWHSYLTGKGKAGRRDRRGGLLQVLVVTPAADNNSIEFLPMTS